MIIDINLLHEKKSSGKLHLIEKIIRITGIVLGVSTLIALTILFVLKREVQSTIGTLNEQKIQLISDITQLQDNETKALILHQKYEDIQAILNEEPDYLSYYETIKRHLPESTTSAQVESLSIASGGEVRVQLNFTNILSLTSFLAKLEQEETKQAFSYIQISGVTFNDEDSTNFPFGLDVTF